MRPIKALKEDTVSFYCSECGKFMCLETEKDEMEKCPNCNSMINWNAIFDAHQMAKSQQAIQEASEYIDTAINFLNESDFKENKESYMNAFLISKKALKIVGALPQAINNIVQRTTDDLSSLLSREDYDEAEVKFVEGKFEMANYCLDELDAISN